MRNLSFPGMAKNAFPKCVIIDVAVCLSVFVRFLFFTTQLCRNFIVSTFISALGSDDNHHKKKPCCLYHEPPESKSDYFAGLARFAEFSSRYYMHEESEFEVATCA